MFKPNLRFARSKSKDEESDGGLDVSNHSSRYARSALPGNNEEEIKVPFMQYMSRTLFVIQLALIFLFIFGTKYSTADSYSPNEYVIYRDIMAMLLIGAFVFVGLSTALQI
jgi:hypothetical protein